MTEYIYRRNLPHFLKGDAAHFVTFTTKERRVLTPQCRSIVLSSCQFYDQKRFILHAVVVMPDHVHLIFTPLREADTSHFTFEETVGRIKSFTAHEINKRLKRTGAVWLDESFDHVLRSEENLENRIEYLRQNPVRRGIVRNSADYKWLWAQPHHCTAGTAVPHTQ
jgi:REP element-mobilizing transposase RayT